MEYHDKNLETLGRRDLETLQYSKLQTLLSELWEKNRFYTAKWRAAGVDLSKIRTLADLSRLPLTSKEELVADQADHPPYGDNLTYPLDRYIRYHQTSGTTGTPLRILDTAESWNWWGKCWQFVLRGAGLRPSDRLFLAFSFGPFIGFWAAYEGARGIQAMAIPGGGLDSSQRLKLMRETEATALCCTPTYALRLAEVARETDFDLSSLAVRVTVHAGEPGANVPATKRRIEAAWGAKCFDHAGASEVGAHSFECQAQPGGCHVIESEFIVEVLNDSLEPVSHGEQGELVITNLGRAGFPVIRYQTGDIVRLNTEPCACGRTFSRFEGGILGRADDMFVIRGINVFPGAVENVIRRFDEVEEFRVTVRVVREMDSLDIEVELRDGANPRIAAEIAKAIEATLLLKATVQRVAPGTLPRFELKAKRFHIQR